MNVTYIQEDGIRFQNIPKVVSDKEADSTVYTDNLWKRNSEKYNRLCEKHFGDTGQTNWNRREPEDIEKFFCDWLDRDVEIVQIHRKEHQTRGYPLWKIDFAYLD